MTYNYLQHAGRNDERYFVHLYFVSSYCAEIDFAFIVLVAITNKYWGQRKQYYRAYGILQSMSIVTVLHCPTIGNHCGRQPHGTMINSPFSVKAFIQEWFRHCQSNPIQSFKTHNFERKTGTHLFLFLQAEHIA